MLDVTADRRGDPSREPVRCARLRGPRFCFDLNGFVLVFWSDRCGVGARLIYKVSFETICNRMVNPKHRAFLTFK